MLFRQSIHYRPFSDEQVSSFETAAGLSYTDSTHWREDLDFAATDLIIDHYNQKWESPSSILKQLRRIERDPNVLLDSIKDEFNALPMPLSAALCHGTGWTFEQLADAAGDKETFLFGVRKEIHFLSLIIERRKEKKITGNQGQPAFRYFINRLAFIFQDAFLQGANTGLSISYVSYGTSADGPFIRFAKAVFVALADNLSVAVTSTDPDLVKLLKAMSCNSSTSIYQHFSRSEYYELVTGDGRI